MKNFHIRSFHASLDWTFLEDNEREYLPWMSDLLHYPYIAFLTYCLQASADEHDRHDISAASNAPPAYDHLWYLEHLWCIYPGGGSAVSGTAGRTSCSFDNAKDPRHCSRLLCVMYHIHTAWRWTIHSLQTICKKASSSSISATSVVTLMIVHWKPQDERNFPIT